MTNNAEIKEKQFLGATEYHLVLPNGFEFGWWRFHKAFRIMDGKTKEDQELINNFYEAYKNLPSKYLKWAEKGLLELDYERPKEEDNKFCEGVSLNDK